MRSAATVAGWPSVTIPSGATLRYPPRWRAVRSDSGSASRALLSASGQFLGYLNLTPRQGKEAIRTWPAFRVDHNREEGDRAVRTVAASTQLRFRTGRGACVEDRYATSIGSHYVELACLVAGAHATVVIVGAAPPSSFAAVGPLLERAIAAVRA